LITISIDPILAHFGPFMIRWYGIIIVAVVLIGLYVTYLEADRRGLPTANLVSLAMYSLIAGLVGARLAHVIDRFDYYAAHPQAIIAVQEGGLAIWGGFAGGFIFALAYCYFKRISFLKLADSAAPALLLGAGLGRFGCLINGDAWGAATGGNWGLVYTNAHAFLPANLIGVPTQPVPLYDMAWNLASFGILWALRKKIKQDGVIFAAFVIVYSIGRIIVTFWRQNPAFLFGLQEAQVIGLAGLIVAVPALTFLLVRNSTSREVVPQS
jgi:phosphatidylglycerol---prolipoprotein diacylglyceryl transferase